MLEERYGGVNFDRYCRNLDNRYVFVTHEATMRMIIRCVDNGRHCTHGTALEVKNGNLCKSYS